MSGLTKIKSISNRLKNFILATAFVLTQFVVPASSLFSGTASALSFDPSECVSDTAGANDEPGQKDLTKLCQASSPATGTEEISWNWDDLGTSGANTMDACALFDSDGDTKINYSVCLTTNDSPATLGTLTIYSCGDTKVDRCTSPNSVISGPYDTSCTVSQQATDPFPVGDFSPTDTVAECTIQLSDLPVSLTNLDLTDVCSYPSQQPNSDPSDCVIITEGKSATVEVIKDLIPSTDDGLFNLSVAASETSTVTDQSDGGTTGVVGIPFTGNSTTVTVSESQGSTGLLSDYDSSVSCVKRGTATSVGSGTGTSLQITVHDKDNIVCTITNTRKSGMLKVVKDVVNDNGGTKTYADFSFTVDGQNYSFDETISPDGEKTVSLPTGTYTVTEPEANSMGYSTSYNNCTDVTVVAGQTTTCTITNNDIAPSLTLNKVLVQDNGGTASESDWTLNAVGSSQTPSSLSGPGAAGSTDVVSGSNFKADTYTLSEADGPSGYSASAWTCTNGVTVNENNQITLSNGQTTVCSITNNDIAPTLTLVKTVTNTYGGTATANDFPVYIGETLSSWGEHTVNAGTYSVSEDAGAVAGYSATDWGGDCSTSGSVTLGVGENKTCTITNYDLPATISGYKYDVNADATAGDGTGTPLQNWTIYLLVNGNTIASTTTDSNGYYEFTGLDWGTYNLAECLGEVVEAYDCSEWTQIYGSTSDITVNGNNLTSSSTSNDFGNFENGSISGYKFNDLNGDGVKQENEPKLADWPFSYVYDANGDDVFNETATNFTTDQSGNFTIPNLAPGKYQVCEDPQTELGWTRTVPSSSNCRMRTIDESGEAATGLVYGNQARGTLTVIKNVDDGFGNVTENASGWTWDYSGDYQSGSNETASSSNTVTVPADSYTVSEDQQSNYHFTNVSCTVNGDGIELDPAESVTVKVDAGDNIVCTFTNTRDTGHISVTKYLDPESDNGLFDLQVNGNTEFVDASDGDTTGEVKVVTSESNNVSELAGTDTDLSHYDSFWVCYSPDNFYIYGEGTVSDNFSVGSDQHVYCAFYNTRHATLTVNKDALPNDPQWFDFTIDQESECEVSRDSLASLTSIDQECGDMQVSNFKLQDYTDSSKATHSEELSPGWYKVTEGDVDGWVLTDIDCGEAEVEIEGNSVWVNLGAGDNVSCTYTNTKLAKVTVVKDAQPDSLQAFTFTSDLSGEAANFNLTDSATLPGLGSKAFDSLMPGTYHISETVVSGWTLKDIDCGEAAMTQDGSGITLTVNPGDDITCTFVNKKNPGHVLGSSTELPNTGQSPLVNFIAGAIIMSLALAVRWFGRKPQNSTL